jgi:hypothetical protein
VNRPKHEGLQGVDIQDIEVKEGKRNAEHREQGGIPADQVSSIAPEFLFGHGGSDDFVVGGFAGAHFLTP